MGGVIGVARKGYTLVHRVSQEVLVQPMASQILTGFLRKYVDFLK